MVHGPTNLRFPSFYGPVDDSQRAALLKAYIGHLEQKNGPPDPATGTLPKREARLVELNNAPVVYAGQVPQAEFDRLQATFKCNDPGLTADLLMLLTFCKMNAGEAYGVRVVKAVHNRRDRRRTDLARQAIVIAQEEEEYHTRILVGAAQHFNLQARVAYHPPLALQALIYSLAYAPRPFFHLILFGSEAAGVYVFNWTLNRLADFYPLQPALRETMAQRLIDILVDEIGHVAFNRLVLSEAGLRIGRALAGQPVRGLTLITPELTTLGFNRQVQSSFRAFDYSSLPDEARRLAFFV